MVVVAAGAVTAMVARRLGEDRPVFRVDLASAAAAGVVAAVAVAGGWGAVVTAWRST